MQSSPGRRCARSPDELALKASVGAAQCLTAAGIEPPTILQARCSKSTTFLFLSSSYRLKAPVGALMTNGQLADYSESIKISLPHRN